MPFTDATLDNLSQTQEIAWRVRSQKRDWMNDRFARMQQLQSVHGSRIDWLKNEGDSLYRQMVDAFERSKSSFSAGDHNGASSWSAQGKQFKARLQDVNSEKSQLIATMKSAHAEFAQARAEHEKVKVEHERAQAAFKERLSYLKDRSAKERAERQREREAKKKERELKSAQRRKESESRHRLREEQKNKSQRRRNEFVDIARRRERELNTSGPRDVQFVDDAVRVEVKNGYSRKFDRYTTDVLIFYRDPAIKYHYHIVFDDDGNVIHEDAYSRDKRRM